MTGAFAAATHTLFTDPNIAVPATVVRSNQRIDVRVVLKTGDEQRTGLDGTMLVGDNVMCDVQSLLRWTPEVGDRLEVAGRGNYEVVRAPESDSESLTWSLELRQTDN